VVCGSAEEAHGVNTPEDLAKVEARLRGGSEAEER
jgi:GTP:adenosylcobinamide-phosphate guanylyltransferase